MQRPLTKTVNTNLDWFMSVREMQHTEGFSFPIFEWSFGQREGFRGGEVHCWSLQCTYTFEDRRERRRFVFDSIENLLAKIDEYGWGKPPFINEVSRDIAVAKGKFKIEGVEDFEELEEIFMELREKWQVLASTS